MTNLDAPHRRPRGLSGDYLNQALDALYAAGDPEALYGRDRRRSDLSQRAEQFLTVQARRERVTQCRSAVLFSALAAEAYINEFLRAHLGAKDFEAVDRLPTREKYLIGTRAAIGQPLFKRDRPPMPAINDLFKLRDKLVHPKPGYGPARFREEPSDFEGMFSPARVGTLLVMVAGAAVVLMRSAYGDDAGMDVPADFIWFGRRPVLAYANRAELLPQRDALAQQGLFAQAVAEVQRGTHLPGEGSLP